MVPHLLSMFSTSFMSMLNPKFEPQTHLKMTRIAPLQALHKAAAPPQLGRHFQGLNTEVLEFRIWDQGLNRVA